MLTTTFSVDADEQNEEDEEVADVDIQKHVDMYADRCGLCLCLCVGV